MVPSLEHGGKGVHSRVLDRLSDARFRVVQLEVDGSKLFRPNKRVQQPGGFPKQCLRGNNSYSISKQEAAGTACG